MPTETEHYTDEEILRDIERDLEAEKAREDFENDEKDFEDESEISKETDDPALQDILEHKGGQIEDWELTHRSSGEYMFDGKGIVDTRTGESLTEKIDSGYDDGYRAAHHETLELLKSGESMIRLPDYIEERAGEEILHVTHLLRAPDGSVSYEIRSTMIGEDEEDDEFEGEETSESSEKDHHVEWHESPQEVVEEQIEVVQETVAHMHETTFYSGVPAETYFETPIVNEAAPEIAEEKEEVAEKSWLSRFLAPESPTPEPVREKIFESLPVFVESVEEKGAEPPVEQAKLAQQEQEASPASKELAVESPEAAVKIEPAPLFNEPITRLIREVVIPKMEQRIVEEKGLEETELSIAEKPEVEVVRESLPLGEHRARHEEIINIKSSGETREQDHVVRSSVERERLPAQTTHEKPARAETIDIPAAEETRSERVMTGAEILQRALGIPTTPRFVATRESVNPEVLRPTRYSPPQNDNTPVQTTSRRTLNGISMRRAG